MSTTIESLELEIKSSADSAERGLNKLAETLGKLRNATKGGLGLTSVSKQLSTLSGVAKGIDSSATKNVEGLAKAVSLLSGSKISASIGNQLKSINSAIAELNLSGGEAKIQELISTLAPLQNLGKTNLSSFITPLKKLPEVLEGLNKLDMGAFANKMKEVANAVKPLADEMYKVAQGFSAFPDKIQKLITSTNKLSASNKKAAGSFTDLYHKLKTAYAAIKNISSKIMSMIKAASTQHETITFFNVSMGEYAKEAGEYAQKVGEIMGIDPVEWMRSQGTFMTLATGFGIVSDRASVMSQQLTQLAYDIASYNDLPVEEAMLKVQSGFAGELEPLRRIGYDLSQAKLEATALSLGIDKTVSSMTQAEKAELRYYAIMTQVTGSHHDMARTLESPANQMRIFTSQVKQCARAIGSIFIPILGKLLPYFTAFVKVVRILAEHIASLFGFTLPEVDWKGGENSTGNIVENLEDANSAAKKLKSYTMGFDELNIISPGDEGDDESAMGTGFDFELPTYNFLEGVTESKVNTIVEKMKEWLGITDDINGWADLFKSKLGGILIVVGLIGAGLLVWKVIEGIAGVIDVLSKFSLGKSKTGASGGDIGGGVSTLTSKLKGLVTNLALGIVIIAEVIVATALFVGGIWLIGKLLEQVVIAWQPVLDNGDTVATAILIGTGLMVAIGLAAYGLGTLGWGVAGQIGIGMLVLAELGVATALFLAEIVIIGGLLNKVYESWQPVLDKGKPIAIAIGVGTGLLVGIGVVAAALGVATVATAGALPVAIALGTALLVELALAFIAFSESLVDVSDQLRDNIHPSLSATNEILPELTSNMKDFTSFMGSFAGEVVKYSTHSSIAAIASTIDTIIGFFTNDPVTKMSNEVDSQNEQFEHLIDGLEMIIPKIEYATELVNRYNAAMGSFDEVSGANKGLLSNLGIVKNAINGIISGIESLSNGVIDGINGMIRALNKLSFTVPDWVPVIGGETFGLNLKTLQRITIPRFAEGGFPAQGQMFIAREAGAEMVGSIGRKTAVANNDQIVSGIASGVAEANTESNALLREQNALLRAMLEKETNTYIDGKKITKTVEKHQRERGMVLVTGGAY